jgi:hypothetical protein
MRTTRGGRPSLIGTAARTAVIAGTATAVSTSVATSKQQKAHQQAAAQQAQIDAAVQQAVDQQAVAEPQPAAASPAGDLIAQLQQLADLHDAGVLSDVEFEAAKAKLLAG